MKMTQSFLKENVPFFSLKGLFVFGNLEDLLFIKFVLCYNEFGEKYEIFFSFK